MYICIKVRTHNQNNDDYIRTNKETQLIGFGTFDELTEMAKKDAEIWIMVSEDSAVNKMPIYENWKKYKGQPMLEYIMQYTDGNQTRHYMELRYIFIEQDEKMFYID